MSDFSSFSQLERADDVGYLTLLDSVEPRKEQIASTIPDVGIRKVFVEEWDKFMGHLKGRHNERGSGAFATSAVKFIYQNSAGR